MRPKNTNGRPPRRVRRALQTALRIFSVVCLIVLGATIGLFGGLYYSVSTLVPQNLGALETKVSDATRIYSSDGELLARLYVQNRDVVSLERIPLRLQQATIAIEDKRFRAHYGFDPAAIVRATLANLRNRGYQQGASTITQQLARNIYLTRKKTLARKFQELTLAIALERRYTKDQILEAYLNQVYYGSGAYGVEAAAQTYFGKHVEDLSLSECALIAGLTQRPSGYSPFNNPRAAIARRNLVLSRMVEDGYITGAEAAEARSEELKLARRPTELRWKAPYFVSYVIQQLSDEYGESTLYQAGLRVYTTLDWRMQKAAEDAVRKGVEANRRKRVGQGALVSMDPRTGFVRAMVGGTDFRKRQFNVITQGNPQPGSTFKVFVYTAALENGWKPSDTVRDEKVWLRGRDKPPWPQNYDRRYHGRVTLKTAVARSLNVPAVLVARSVGLDEVIRYARAMGITANIPENLSIALGSTGVRPIEMNSAYCVIANGGFETVPVAVTRVTTADGGVIYSHTPPVEPRRVIRQTTAEGMDEMLRAVVTSGTARSVARRVADARGKTGTTDEDRHAWFIGYTPELVTTVWVGNDVPIPMDNVWGSNVCAPIWCDFMRVAIPLQREFLRKKEAERAAAREGFTGAGEDTGEERPAGRSRRVTLNVCDDSGLLAGPACPSTHRQTFRVEDAPAVQCDIHTGEGPPPDSIAPPEEAPEPTAVPPPAQPGAASPDARPAASHPEPGPAASTHYVSLLICADSGQIASTACPHVVRRRFRADLAPTRVCTMRH